MIRNNNIVKTRLLQTPSVPQIPTLAVYTKYEMRARPLRTLMPSSMASRVNVNFCLALDNFSNFQSNIDKNLPKR